jgi:hypothetical protein
MVRNATPQETALRNALATLAAVKADPAVTKGRTIIAIGDRMRVVCMPIGKLLTFIRGVKPIEVQRNDLYRLNNGLAKHLENFELPQAMMALVYFEGTFYLVDGNTRKRSWLNQTCRPLPSHVFVTLMGVDSLEQGKKIYNCYDSKGAKKTNRDDLVSMLHSCGVDPSTLKDKLVAAGKLVTVVQCMARAMSGGSASPQRKLEVVQYHAAAFRDVASLGLDEGVIPGGAVWALLRLYREVPAEFHGYVGRYADEMRKLTGPQKHLVASTVLSVEEKARKACFDAQVGTSGSAPIPVMFPAYLAGFARYGRQLVRLGEANKKFAAFLTKFVKATVEPDIERAYELQARAPKAKV